ncbi:hypothetical protein MML48_2g00007840 [Holotrichia oblita]|uniref:Uncharacterized protein n=1 Tax=Holotrichia oblita TaxID=644536 RepID=A0ACB9TJF7_HOLOL|nr:hypothetical protein MML48_2g00007840 [Holotrichia oblita]
MRIEVPISESTREVYLEGLKEYPDLACKPQRDPTGTLTVFELDLDDVFRCATTRIINQMTGRQIFYQTVIVEEGGQDGKDTPSTVTSLHVKCSRPTILGNHTITRRNILPEGFQEEDVQVIEEYTSSAPKPELGVGVRQGGKLVTGELNVSPGTPLQMEIYLSKVSAPIYGLLVTMMQVTDTKTQEETIIYNGCSVDPYLFENFNTVDGDFLTAKFKAFKFPDSTYVQFKGTVNVCLDKCKGVECSAGQIGYGRRKREVSSLPADPNKIFEITITSILKFGDEEIEVVKNDLKFLNDKKLFVADQLREKVYHSEEDPSHLRIEEEYITAESGSVSIALTSWLVATLATIYRLFV